jgi:hypothetical protein
VPLAELDDERAFMVEEAIQNVGRLASVSRNNLGVERRKPVRNVGIELYAWFRPVVGVVIDAIRGRSRSKAGKMLSSPAG